MSIVIYDCSQLSTIVFILTTMYLDLTLHELSQYGLSMELIRNNSLDIKKKFRKIIIKYYIAFLSRIYTMFKRYI